MTDSESPSCDECEQAMFHLDGQWFCESCDSVSGFELTPNDTDF